MHFDGSVVDASPYSVPVSAEAGTSFAAGKFGQGFIGKNFSSDEDPSPITTPDGYILIIYLIFTTQKIKII